MRLGNMLAVVGERGGERGREKREKRESRENREENNYRKVGVVLLLSNEGETNQKFRELWLNYEEYRELVDVYEIPSLDQFVSSKIHQKWILLVSAKDL